MDCATILEKTLREKIEGMVDVLFKEIFHPKYTGITNLLYEQNIGDIAELSRKTIGILELSHIKQIANTLIYEDYNPYHFKLESNPVSGVYIIQSSDFSKMFGVRFDDNEMSFFYIFGEVDDYWEDEKYELEIVNDISSAIHWWQVKQNERWSSIANETIKVKSGTNTKRVEKQREPRVDFI